MVLYYKSLTSHMKSFNKNNKLQGLNDELHNLALKELLNKDNAMYNQAANKVQREHLEEEIREKLYPTKKENLSKEYYENLEHDKLQKELDNNIITQIGLNKLHKLNELKKGNLLNESLNKHIKKENKLANNLNLFNKNHINKYDINKTQFERNKKRQELVNKYNNLNKINELHKGYHKFEKINPIYHEKVKKINPEIIHKLEKINPEIINESHKLMTIPRGFYNPKNPKGYKKSNRTKSGYSTKPKGIKKNINTLI